MYRYENRRGGRVRNVAAAGVQCAVCGVQYVAATAVCSGAKSIIVYAVQVANLGAPVCPHTHKQSTSTTILLLSFQCFLSSSSSSLAVVSLVVRACVTQRQLVVGGVGLETTRLSVEKKIESRSLRAGA